MNIFTLRDSLAKFSTTYFGGEVDCVILPDSDVISIRKTIYLDISHYLGDQETLLSKFNEELSKTVYVKNLRRKIEELEDKLSEYREKEITKETLSEL